MMYPLLFVFLLTCGYFLFKFSVHTTRGLNRSYELLRAENNRRLISLVKQKKILMKYFVGLISFHIVSHLITAFIIIKSQKGAANFKKYETSAFYL